MRRQGLWAAAMLLGAWPFAYAPPVHAAPDLSKAAKIELARNAELKGDVARAREDFFGAESHYQKAVRNDRKNAALYNKLGIVQLKNGNRRGARDSFGRAVKIDSRNVHALNNLGALYCLDKKYKPAIENLKRALALDESMASAHINMAEAWMGNGDMNRAMTEYARAIELDPDILSSGRSGVIAQVTTPEQRARVNYLIAKAYAKRGNIDGAIDYLQRAKEGHFPQLHKVYEEQEFAALWTDPRLEKIVKK